MTTGRINQVTTLARDRRAGSKDCSSASSRDRSPPVRSSNIGHGAHVARMSFVHELQYHTKPTTPRQQRQPPQKTSRLVSVRLPDTRFGAGILKTVELV